MHNILETSEAAFLLFFRNAEKYQNKNKNKVSIWSHYF